MCADTTASLQASFATALMLSCLLMQREFVLVKRNSFATPLTLFWLLMQREFVLVKRNSFLYIFPFLCYHSRTALSLHATRVCAGEEELLPLHLTFPTHLWSQNSPYTGLSPGAARVCAGEEELLPLHLPLLPDHVHGGRHGHPLPAHPAAPQLPLPGPALLRRGLLLPHHAHVRRLCGDDLHHFAPAGILQAARWGSSSLPLLSLLCTM